MKLTMPKLPPLPECSREEFMKCLFLTNEEAGKLRLPPSWEEVKVSLPGNRTYRKGRLYVIFGVDAISWGGTWLHVSMSRKDRIPNYDEMVEVKKVFIGDHRQAVQVFPKKEKHISIHPNCLHLWCCLDPEGDGLPDFGKFGTI